MFANLHLSELRDKYQRLSLREQLLVVTVIVAAAYFLMDIFVYSPQKAREQDLLSQQKQLESQALVLNAEISVVDKTAKEALALKEVEYHQVKKQAQELMLLSESVNPDPPKVRELIGQILAAQRSGVQAVGVKTQPVKLLTPVARPAETAAKPASTPGMPAARAASVYRHGLEIELRGRYLDLMAYLQKLEQSNPQLFWANASLESSGTGESAFRAAVFLLSNQGQTGMNQR